MKKLKKTFTNTGRFAALLLCLAMICVCLAPIAANAAEEEKTVRVGWYESPFNTIDRFGRRSGYAYEYQKKIAAYSGWNYEYVTDSWPNLMQMLIDGEIDMLSDVSYTEERSDIMLFPHLPMGAEEYYIFISPDNKDYSPGDYSYFNGKKVGVNKGSFQVEVFREWEKTYDISSGIIELTCSEAEAFEMMRTGELDAYITLDHYGGVDIALPVIKIGSSDYFFAINHDRPDLLDELNSALSRIVDENPFYAQELNRKYLSSSGANIFLTNEEKQWLTDHGKIRIGYQDDYLAFCAADKSTGELIGALNDYLEDASTCFENADLEFEPVAYSTAAELIQALKDGEVDCMFPSNISTSDGESLGFVLTPSIISTEIYAVVRKADQQTFMQKEEIPAAIIAGDPNCDAVLMDHFPNWKCEGYPDIQSCLNAVSNGTADCVIISNYHYNNLGKQFEKLNLTALATGEIVDYYIAVRNGDTELFSILTRTTNIVNKANINSALSYYSVEESKATLIDFIRDNPAIDIAVIVVIAAFVLVIIAQQRIIIAKREVEKSHHQVDDLNKLVYVDALTSLRNKGGFDEYLRSIQNLLDSGDPFEFAIVMLDCNDLKPINDQYGHDKGDIYLQASSQLACRVYKNSPVFRIGGDEFAVILQDKDYKNRKALMELFKTSEANICASAKNEWEKVSMAIGMAEYDPQSHRSVDDVVHLADKNMYENKRAAKKAKSES